MFEPALATIRTLFRILDITYAGELLFSGADKRTIKGNYLRDRSRVKRWVTNVTLFELRKILVTLGQPRAYSLCLATEGPYHLCRVMPDQRFPPINQNCVKMVIENG